MFGVLNTAALVAVGVLSSASVLMPLFACICACMHVQLAVQSDSVASIGTCGAWPDGVITGGLTLNQMSVHTAQVSAPRQQQECPDLRRSLTTSHPTLLLLCSWCACCPHLLSHPSPTSPRHVDRYCWQRNEAECHQPATSGCQHGNRGRGWPGWP